MSVAIEFRDLVKDFGPVRILHGISFALEPGFSYGLLGENGAGKSTLMKILSGFESATSGEVRVNGQPVRFDNSRAAEDQGIVLIHQEFSLAEHLTIAQNLFLGHEKKRGWLLDDAAMQKEAATVLAQVGLQVDVNSRVRDLIVAEKQLVEIARALLRRARMLIMDEVERMTDRVVVLRDGRLVAQEATPGLGRQQMAKRMVGRELANLYPPRDPPSVGMERYARPWLKVAEELRALQTAVTAFGIRTGDLHSRASSLSGANQQKLALAKVLHPQPRVVVLDEPTRDVDVGAKSDIYLLIQRLAREGLAVIIISSELVELIGLCHRAAVMRAGRLQTVLQADQLTEQELIAHATGTH